MKHLKRWLALLVSAALALTLLAGCGSGSIQRNSLVQLLSGQLENVQVTGDAAFDRALKTAVRQGGSDPEAVLSALAEELGISAPLSFSISALSGGKAGQQSLDVVFQPGSDPDTAANNAASGWLPTLRGLGSSGEYSARVSLAETDGGCILAIEVTVEQPGSSEESSGGGDDTSTLGPTDIGYKGDGYEVVEENGQKVFKVNNANGLGTMAELVNEEGKTNIDITLDNNIDLTGEWTPIGTESQPYTGTFNGNNKTITGLTVNAPASDYVGLFGFIGTNGKVENLTLEVASIKGQYYVGGIAGYNDGGAITGCEVNINKISSTSNSTGTGASAFAGGIAGYNDGGAITNCTVTVNGSITAERDTSNSANAGGIVGYNPNGTITGCTVTVKNSQSISATGNGSAALAGGIAGSNDGTIGTGCGVTLNDGSSITAETTGSNPGTAFAGGIVGQNNGTVECGPVTNAHATANYDNTNGTKYTATVSYGTGSGPDTDTAGDPVRAYAGTKCGWSKGNPVGNS